MLVVALTACMGAASAQNPADRENPGAGRDPRLSEGQIAPVLEGLGDYSMPVTVATPRTQLFFDQGFRLSYAFNHKEAVRAFDEAIRLDPKCAMAHWGRALALGPNINMTLARESGLQAYESIQNAVALKKNVSPKEADLIDALAQRFEMDPKDDRVHLDAAYADAMATLVSKYPDDLDIATLYAAALMNTNPWDYWWPDGQPYETTMKADNALRSVLERNPSHPGSCHYFIHLMEAFHPERAEDAADNLAPLMPGAGHIVHMPAHIYMRVGRYREAYDANVKAVAADEGYITQCRAQGIYPLGYYPHNIHFMWFAASEYGRSADAIAAARKTASKSPVNVLDLAPNLERMFTTPYLALVRFGKWDAVLAEPEPPEGVDYGRAIWHFARGNAYRAKGELQSAQTELDSLKALRRDGAIRTSKIDHREILDVASMCLEAEIAAKRGDFDKAVSLLESAVRQEQILGYTEPPYWHAPVRLSLGAVLLEADRADEAEVVYWEALRRHPENGWILFGLWQSLDAQDKPAAKMIKERFDKAWDTNSVTLHASRF